MTSTNRRGPRGQGKQWAQVLQVLPGLALGFFEVTVLTSVSVAISTRLPMLVNLVVCISIFFLGHLTPILVDVTGNGNTNELVHFMAQLFAFALPELEFFNAEPVDLDRVGDSLGWATFCRPWDIACCTVERRSCSRSSCSKTATWPDQRGDPIAGWA